MQARSNLEVKLCPIETRLKYVTFTQKRATAKFGRMRPRAVYTDCVDFV
jgi:hypothetical protein